MSSSTFVIEPGSKVRLKDHDPAYTGPVSDEKGATKACDDLREELVRQQDMLLAREEHAVVVVVQGMDGAGKDGTIKALASLLDPQSCHAHSLNKPAGRELKHDYLRRYVEKLPQRGQITIFNRSYYESVIVGQIHPERLDEEALPEDVRGRPDLYKQRYRQINDFERYLAENGIIVLKFFMHLSHEKQRERFMERLKEPEKFWKFDPSDMVDRGCWDKFQRVYEEVLTETSTEFAPWRVIPADHRWISSLAVTQTLLETLQKLEMEYPVPDEKTAKEMKKAGKALEKEK